MEPQPNMNGALPTCAETDCVCYDGKRCELMGFRPYEHCVPALMRSRLEQQKQQAKLVELRGIVERLSHYFQSDNIDPHKETCVKCGLNIRSEVHIRAAKAGEGE